MHIITNTKVVPTRLCLRQSESPNTVAKFIFTMAYV